MYLNIPEALPRPRLSVDSRILAFIVPINSLCVPLKMPNEIGIEEVVHNPIPQWAGPGFVRPIFPIKFKFNLVALKLGVG